ncbi:MAG: AMIN domain-containing protein, partial [Hyphomicrobium sp.]
MSSGFLRVLVRAAAVCFAATYAMPLSAEETQVVAAADTAAKSNTTSEPPAQSRGGAHTRFVVGLDRQCTFQVFSLANPNRVVVELPDVQLQLPEAKDDVAVGLVKSFRGGQAAPGKTRVVIDVTQPVVVESAK